MEEPYLKQLGRAAVKAAVFGIGLGIGVDGTILLLFYLGLLERLVCK